MAHSDTADLDLTDKAYRSLRHLIESGGVQPRQRLSHRVLSRDLAIGRSPVRDALLRLEAEGLLEHRRGSGVYLREVTLAELEHVYELRIVNEPHFAGEAARHATAEQTAAIEQLCDRMARLAARRDLVGWLSDRANVRRAARLDIAFHKAVLAAAGNPVAMRLFTSPNILALSFAWELLFMKPEWLAEVAQRSLAGHRAVAEAIRRRDPAAASRAMREHLVWGRRDVPRQYAKALRAERGRHAGGRKPSRP